MTFQVGFYVEGEPVPQGSTRAFSRGGKIHTTNDPSGRIERWRGDIRTAAKQQLPGSFECLAGPVRLGVVFAFARPKSHYLPVTRSRPEPVLRPDAPLFCTARADLDKCVRAVMDALTHVVYVDDAQVVQFGHTEKVWSNAPGAIVTVGEIVQ